jgi:hypothetical protein
MEMPTLAGADAEFMMFLLVPEAIRFRRAVARRPRLTRRAHS